MVVKATELEIAWMAGLLEGEGYFGLAQGYPTIVLVMTDFDVVEHAAKLFGKRVYRFPPPKKANRKQLWKASVTGSRAADWMRAIRPFMGDRRGDTIDRCLSGYVPPSFWDEKPPVTAQIPQGLRAWLATEIRAESLRIYNP